MWHQQWCYYAARINLYNILLQKHGKRSFNLELLWAIMYSIVHSPFNAALSFFTKTICTLSGTYIVAHNGTIPKCFLSFIPSLQVRFYSANGTGITRFRNELLVYIIFLFTCFLIHWLVGSILTWIDVLLHWSGLRWPHEASSCNTNHPSFAFFQFLSFSVSFWAKDHSTLAEDCLLQDNVVGTRLFFSGSIIEMLLVVILEYLSSLFKYHISFYMFLLVICRTHWTSHALWISSFYPQSGPRDEPR